MWDLPRPGIEPVSPALAGGFLTTVPTKEVPEGSNFFNLFQHFVWSVFIILAILVGVKWYLIVVGIFTSLMTNDV